MKELLITFGLSTSVIAAFAQGTVNPGNFGSTLFRTNSLSATFFPTGENPTAPTLGGFMYEVLTAPSTVTTVDASLQGLLSGPWSDTGLGMTNTSFFSGGRENGPSGSAGIVANWPESARQSFIVVGWSASVGNDWTTVKGRLAGANFTGATWTSQGKWIPGLAGQMTYGGFIGASTIQAGASGLAGNNSLSLFGAASSAQGTPITTPTELWIVDAIPEPRSFALGGLGAAAMLIFRRWKEPRFSRCTQKKSEPPDVGCYL
jgi:hypothetical protein